MERKVYIDGKEYILYEKAPIIEPSKTGLIKTEMERREKKSREQDWKQRARKGCHKK